MTWSAFWIEYSQFLAMVGDFLSTIPGIVVSMIFAPIIFAIMYGFVHMLRGLRS